MADIIVLADIFQLAESWECKTDHCTTAGHSLLEPLLGGGADRTINNRLASLYYCGVHDETRVCLES